MMMRQVVSRRAATTGGFTFSILVHAGLFLLISLLLRAGAETVRDHVDELTEIAYIEARYGEDVAKKVRLKTKPKVVPKPQPAEPVQEAKTAEPEPPVPQPALRSRPRLQSLPKLVTRPVLKSRQVADLDAPRLTPAQRRELAQVQTRRLESKRFAEVSAPGIDTGNLRHRDLMAADLDAPKLTSRQPRQQMPTAGKALVGRKSKLDLSDVDFEVGHGGGNRNLALELPAGGVEGGNAALVGGRLEPGQEVYKGDVASLLPRGKERRPAAAVDAPVELAANTKGRRTLLDYGPGNVLPSSRPSLKGRRAAVAEAPSAASIAETAPQTAPQQELAETGSEAMSGKGVSMTISGQIVGRKVVKSVLPIYSERARRQGWEGVVAVHFTVLPDGRVKDNVYIQQASTHQDLNRAALAAIRQFRFEPLPQDKRVEQWGVITIVFRLS